MARLARQARVDRSIHAVDFARLDAALARGQSYLLFTAILLVPLIVLPESQFVTFTSTPKGAVVAVFGCLLAAVLSTRLALRLFAGGHSLIDLRGWARESRVATWILASALVAGLCPLVSSLLSQFGSISFWGRDPGTAGGSFGLVLYLFIFLAAFWTAREMRSLKPLVSTVALAVGLAGAIGAAQYFGFAPFGISNTTASFGRLSGTAGNPVFFGALLAIGLPLILTHRDLLEQRQGRLNWALLGIAVLAAIVLTLAVAGTGSRGPWLGAVTGLAISLAALAWLRGLRYISVLGVVIAVPAITTILAMSVLGGPATSAADDSSESAVATGTFDRVGSTGSVERRLRYWSMGLEMAITRPDVPFAGSQDWLQLFLFGNGPDTARYLMALEADEDLLNRQFTTLHNDPLNRLLEQGLVGFLAWTALWGAIALGSVHVLRRARNSGSTSTGLIGAGLAGAFCARFVEQLTGMAMPGDQVIFWVLVGVLAALCMRPRVEADAHTTRLRLTTGRQAAFAGVVAVITIVGIFLAWDRGVEYLAASHKAAILNGQKTVTYDAAVTNLVAATTLAPDVTAYRIKLADVYRDAAMNPASGQSPVETLWLAYDQATAAFEANPYDLPANFRLAQASWDLALAGVSGKGAEAVAIYERLEILAPNHPLVAERLPALRAAIEVSQ